MKIAVFGAGAIGGHLGAMLCRTDTDVTLIARGAHCEAIRTNGLKLLSGGEEFVVRPRATDDPAAAGVQDYVFVTLKSHQAPGAVTAMQPMLGPDTTVITAMNGIPWWYFHGLGGPLEGKRVDAVDPGGAQWDGIGPRRALGCITFVAAAVTEPGVVKHEGGIRYLMGEPDGSMSPRLERIAAVCKAAGLDAEARPAIRDDIWLKLLGNVGGNPVAALTMATIGEMVGDPGVRSVLRSVMVEAMTVARTLGANPEMSVDQRLDHMVVFKTHKSSMLQDLERGKMLEIDPIVRSVAELGDLVGVDTPCIDTIYALTRLRARMGGMYPA